MKPIELRVWDNAMIYDNFIALNSDPKFVMQYTGRKSIDGVKIFDKDIIISNHGYEKREVWWCEDSLQWWASDHPLSDLESIQVIGNIYENPEYMIILTGLIEDDCIKFNKEK